MGTLKEIDSGPYELRLNDGSGDQRVGFAWYEGGGGEQSAYFVLKDGIPFPLPYGPDVTFSPHQMSEVNNSEEFYEWVMQNGELGENTTSWQVSETYQSWH
ncbi:hypothetical protein FIV42_07330 [Persicimonas caeni]|uniref:Uncharacterized protein n=1 Tax=Persicimonas caeni TaxID=2292766 RepID=A0A4Y6PQM3_PERCE|nr:hypothetical protein [Persicimonas caeni]QDG50550.1 hypothetical protein FIV42_07330 [Persicimonas caeni]QED31771.1 hypothetical protein FRD00_07325 [Persicimonas caeni]